MGSIKGIKIELSLIDDLLKATTENSVSKKEDLVKLANFYKTKAVKARTLIKNVPSLKDAAKTLGDDAMMRRLVQIELNLNAQIKDGEKNDSILRSLS